MITPGLHMDVAHCYCGSPSSFLLNFGVKIGTINLQLVFVVLVTKWFKNLMVDGEKVYRLNGWDLSWCGYRGMMV